MEPFVLRTKRLRIRRAAPEDAEHYLRLWTDPRVMRFVGFPHGLRIGEDEIRDRIRREGPSEFGALLVVEVAATGERIGEAFLHPPDAEGVAGTDVKLVPEAWGHRHGAEVKAALVDHLFRATDCVAVRATPHRDNVASIRMQEAVGGVRVGEGCFTFPEEMRAWTCPVPHLVYHVRRADRERGRGQEPRSTTTST